MDGLEIETVAGLSYPFQPPASGAALEVAKGVHWLRMPLPFKLDHINLYLIEEEGGWTLIDTGLGDPKTGEIWRGLFETVLCGKPILNVICTHMHPDHIGQAGFLTRHFGCPLWMSRLEYITARMLVADTGREAPEEGITFFRAAGWTPQQIETYRQRFGMFGRGVTPLPDAFHRIEDRQNLRIGGRDWRVITGSGHCPEHVCLWQPDLKLFISGDQVLPKISSNVSVWPTEPEADPLGDWLESCWRLMAAVPDDVLVLPSHNAPFHGLHARLEGLIDNHESALERLSAFLEEGPKRAVDTFSILFKRPIGDGIVSMATGEAVAHLNHLRHKGYAQKQRDDEGVDWYEATDLGDLADDDEDDLAFEL